MPADRTSGEEWNGGDAWTVGGWGRTPSRGRQRWVRWMTSDELIFAYVMSRWGAYVVGGVGGEAGTQ